jgi:3,4-dihydroxy 2-butanone 4-phosphate synthase/GTP cyclohydrolase II
MHQTAFTVTVDAVNTEFGVSAREQTTTCLALATSNEASSFRRPGHVSPLVACDGGLINRKGCTEAAIDLCRLAGLGACAAMSTITTSDKMGVANKEDVLHFAKTHNICVITIQALVEYRTNPTIT